MQRDMLSSNVFITTVVAGRGAGKSTGLLMAALEACRTPNTHAMVLSDRKVQGGVFLASHYLGSDSRLYHSSVTGFL